MTTQETESEPRKGGLLDSAKTLLSTLLEMGRTRLDLISTEIEEEREWLTTLLLWTLVAFFCTALAVVLFTMLIVIIFWDSYRLLAIGIMMAIFMVTAAVAWRAVRNMNKNKPRLFSTTVTELSLDIERLSSPHEK